MPFVVRLDSNLTLAYTKIMKTLNMGYLSVPLGYQ